jgi:hypothetical protein
MGQFQPKRPLGQRAVVHTAMVFSPSRVSGVGMEMASTDAGMTLWGEAQAWAPPHYVMHDFVPLYAA